MNIPLRRKTATGSLGILMLILLGPWGTGSLSSHRFIFSSWAQELYWTAGPEWNVYRVDYEGRPLLWHVLQWEVRPEERHVWIRHWQLPTLADMPSLTYEALWDGDRLAVAREAVSSAGSWPSAWRLWVLVRLLPVDPTQESLRAVMRGYSVTRIEADAEAWTVGVANPGDGQTWTFRLEREFPYGILEARSGRWAWYRVDHFRVPLIHRKGAE